MELSSELENHEPASANLKIVLTKRRVIPRLSDFDGILKTFSPSERLLFYIFTAALGMSTLTLLAGVNARASVTVPGEGGTLTEGVIGTARFINPLLAITEPDRDLAYLVYSGLTRISPNGTIISDLASSYEISEDGTTYTFTLRQNLTFHDGTLLTAEDVMFTIRAAQNPDIKSSRRADWEGVTVATPDPKTVVFTLPRPYAPFLENTTLGILPAHVWQSVSPEEFPFTSLNTNPIGSGPFKVSKIERDKTGAAILYELTPFNRFTLGTPHLKKITMLFFSNETTLVDAWNTGHIDSFAGVSPSELSHLNGQARIIQAPLPRIFGVFFNQGHAPVLADLAVRAALDAAIDKQTLVNSILGGYTKSADTREESTPWNGIEEARAILERSDWEYSDEEQVWQKDKQNLTFSLATSDSPELSATAEALAASWRAAGINVDIHVYPVSELNSTVIRPRAYDAILFGEVVGRTLDLFAFWHSSQRNDPGLNLALYTNSRADDMLANARATTNRKEREALYTSFTEILEEERPAIFLYAPELLYVLPETIQGVQLGTLTTPAERFSGVYKWYTNTEQVWSILVN